MTSILRWDPFVSMTNFQDQINRIFDDVVRSRDVEDDINLYTWKPAVDIYNDNGSINITAELPGVDKKDVSVDIKDNTITIKGERVIDKETKEENYYRRERKSGSFHRAFTLPYAVSSDTIKAKFKDGILRVEIPKPEEEKPRQISVTHE
ncbi:MAG: Hsp20/alpha crystallin family protein [Desulfobacterium sp.]|nr:Hsp20/alpha crystallin family protein [Desulfobacterium sp.]